MSTSPARNPYSQDGAPNFYGVEPVSVPDPTNYADGTNGNTQYIRNLGWAPELDARIGDTPDP